MKFKGRRVAPYKKRRNYSFWLSWQKKESSSFFLAGGTSFSLNFFELQLKKVHPWVGEKLKFSFCPMSWTLVVLAIKRRELNLNWTSLTLYSSENKISLWIAIEYFVPSYVVSPSKFALYQSLSCISMNSKYSSNTVLLCSVLHSRGKKKEDFFFSHFLTGVFFHPI